MTRPRLSTRRDLVFALILLAAAFGCAAGGPRPPTAAELAGQNAKTIVVAPLNVASSLPFEFEGSSEIVSTTLVAYLEEHGKTVKKLNFQGARELWVIATRQVGQSKQKRTFENAASAYAREIAKQVDYDVLIIPTIYIQSARLRSNIAKWDGARESIRVEGKEVLFKRDTGFDSMVADVKAASLMAAIFSSEGSELQSERRGLQLIEHVHLTDRKVLQRGAASWSFAKNSPPLDDRLKIRAGIAGALAPFLPELEAAPETVEAGGDEPD